MAGHTEINDQVQLGALGSRMFTVGLALAAVGLAVALGFAFTVDGGLDRFFESYLVTFAFYLSITLGALFFVLVQHVTRAGWSVAIRRIAEALTQNFWLMLILFLPILFFGMDHLYHWTHEGIEQTDELIAHKKPYLNMTFFTVRWVIYFAAWLLYSTFFFRTSRKQDETGDHNLTLRMERHSTHGIIVFAMTLTFAAVDMLMTLDAHWFSTMFGVYYFAGSVLAIFSTMAITMFLLQRSGHLEKTIGLGHYYDVGKFMFGFVVFWAYIAFSQFMLIWVADIPEETGWFFKRQQGGWAKASLLLIVGHFALPFLFLIFRSIKMQKLVLASAAVYMLVMHWWDLFWIVMPEFHTGTVPVHFVDFALMAGVGGLYIAWTARTLSRGSLLCIRDPRLPESLEKGVVL